MAPPVRYADGNYYIKIGANTPTDYHPNNLTEIQDWFRNGDSDIYLGDFERAAWHGDQSCQPDGDG